MRAFVDDGTSTKKKGKMGFKVDRAKNFWDRLKGVAVKKNKKEEPTRRIKAVAFDEKERKDYLLGMHKRKNERRVTAVIERKKKHRKDQSKLRREMREEARQQYNSAAQVPILPNYAFVFPQHGEDPDVVAAAASAGEQPQRRKQRGSSIEREDITDDDDDVEGNDANGDDDGDLDAAAVTAWATDGGRIATSTHHVGADESSYVTVSVQSLGRARSVSANPLTDATMPVALRQRLAKVRATTKGPAQPKIAVRAVRELRKIAHINKHSRKGHGKKSKSGKRKNRK